MTDTEVDGVTSDLRGATLVLTMSNPGRRNAFYPEMRDRISSLISRAAGDAKIRAVVLTGADGHFCSGADLKRVAAADNTVLAVRERLKSVHGLLKLISGGAKPVISAVEGDAFGAGMSLAVASDIVIAGRTARFGASFAKIGLLPDMGLLKTLPDRVGVPKARQLMMTARTVLAEEAADIGLADEVVEEGSALSRALEIAQELSASAPLSLAMIKSALGGDLSTLDAVAALELDLVPLLASSEDHQKARDAFLNKTSAVFSGR